MKTERWGGSAKGRSTTVARGDTIWTVSNARDPRGDIRAQIAETLDLLDASLEKAGSDRTHLLSVQVVLADISNREIFDAMWCRWIGDNPEHWPQRAVLAAALAPGLLLEIMATASREVGAESAGA